MTALVTVKPEVPRDGWKRPLITPPGGGKPVAYTRASNYAKCVENSYLITQWEKRMVMLGLVDRPDLRLSVAAHRDDKQELNRIAKQAKEYAKANAAATIGTALHKIVEQVDLGQTIGQLPPEYVNDIDAYSAEIVRRQLVLRHIEQFMVNDDLRVGGTPDRIVEYHGDRPDELADLDPNPCYIADVKTGGVDYPSSFATQLALYAHSQVYDIATGTRTPVSINQDLAIIIDLPAGEGRCQLHWIRIDAGWEAVEHATWVRGWHKRGKDLLMPFDKAISSVIAAGLITDRILAEIGAAQSRQQLIDVYRHYESQWTDQHTAAATNRQAALQEGEHA